MKKEPAFSEADMYLPVKEFFLSLGYSVHGEVKNCDIALMKGERLTIIELKKSFNLQLLFQALDRQKYCDDVYIAVPRLKKGRNSKYNDIINLVRRLNIGLIMVAMDSPLKTVDMILLPSVSDNGAKIRKNKRKRDVIEKEMKARSIDINTGGSNKKKLMTAYREKSLNIACIINQNGAVKASELVKVYGFEQNIYNLFRFNSYGWFVSAGQGRYGLSSSGEEALKNEEYHKIVEYYKKSISDGE